MANFPITLVRHSEEQSRELLTTFVFGGRYGGYRVPRGISPEFVSRFIGTSLEADSSTDAYARTLAVLRYYECSDVLPHLGQVLTGRESDATAVLRSCYVLQAMADLGSQEDNARSGAYFDQFLVPHASLTTTLYPALCETLIVLAPSVSPAKLAHRLAAEVAALTPKRGANESALMEYDKLAAIQRNDLPAAIFAIQIKDTVARLVDAQRHMPLVRIYLGLDPGGEPLDTWAARSLRRQSMDYDPRPVWDAFRNELDGLDVPTLGEQRAKFIIVRAAQAIIYLGGTLTAAQSKLYDKSLPGAANFLWDR
jgi:hypothetical protein